MKIIYEDNHLLVVNKPINVPCQKDSSNDEDLLSMLKKYLKEKYNKLGNVYLGLVHRLDRPVGGIMVFAKTSKAASRLSEQIRNKIFKKTYLAVVTGHPKSKGIFRDKLLKDRKNNITKISPLGKEAELSYEVIASNSSFSLIKINLKTGRSHQIRVQFVSRGYPLVGDKKYNSTSYGKIGLFAYEISFVHPTTKENMTFSLDISNRKPFNYFKDVIL